MARCAIAAWALFFVVSVVAEPIVLRTVRHVNAHTPDRSKRDEAELYSENLVNDLETYAVEIGLGSPAKPYRVVIDTGSADLFVYSSACPKSSCPGPAVISGSAVPCSNSLACKSCRKTDNQCLFNQTFNDGATCSGRVLADKITFGDINANAYVGLVDTATGGPGRPAFFTNESVSGIFGLLPTASTSNFGVKSPIMSLIEANKLTNGMTLCLRPTGGALILGEDFQHTRSNYQWSKLTSRSLYTVKINDVGLPRKGVTGGLLGIATDLAILDSATTNIVFPAVMQDKIKAAFKAHCKRLKMKGICDDSPSIWTNFVQLSNAERIRYPNMVFYIDGLERALSVSPKQYMTEYNGYYTMNIDFSGLQIILGNGFMKNFRIAIDLDTREVGFGDMRTCPGGQQPPKPTDEDTYRVIVNSSFTGFKFGKQIGYRYGNVCGGVAPKDHCVAGVANCAADKPLWAAECDVNSALGLGIEVEARFGRPVNAADGHSVLGTRDIAMPADLPIGNPFLIATLKFYNSPIAPETAPYQVTMRTSVDFTTPHGIDTYAMFSFDAVMNITNYGKCEAKGCPWNDPASWPSHLVNKKCKQGRLADGTPCCPYWTSPNSENQCASVVELASDYDINMKPAELAGELYKIFFIGFHEDSSEHRNDRRLYNLFTADVGTITAANLHARLIPLCPQCPPGTKREVHADGSCTCQCATSCELPLVGEPDCSCIERISHDAVCNYFCDAGDYASVPCVGGTLYVTDGNHIGVTLPPTPPGCENPVYDPIYDDYYDGFYYGDGSFYGTCAYYNDMYCTCVCSTGCPSGAIQNADCTCACPACPANKFATDNCACACRDGCPAGMVQNPDSCECSCPAGCPGNKIQHGDCSCSCAAGCPGGHIQNPDSCDCSCPGGCPAGQVQNGDCSCSCPSSCPAGMVQNGDCSCSCSSGCPAGMIQNSASCECSCPAGCPAGQVQNGDCSCSCPHGCQAGKTQNGDCSCSCPAGCPAGMVQNADSCECGCASGCPAGMVQNGDCFCACTSGCPAGKVQNGDCSCSCPSGCPTGKVQDPNTCMCACASDCPASHVQDAESCACHCPSSCSPPHVQDSACSCGCPTTDCGAFKSLDATSCSCVCPHQCDSPRSKVNADDCSCECPSTCLAPRVQNADCSCSCPNTCTAGQIRNEETCACEASCQLTCSAPKTVNTDACRCDCVSGCAAGKIQDPNCACSCASSCPAPKVQDPTTCDCSCPADCPAGTVQNPDTCECSCPTACPAGLVRNVNDCGCHCATSCTGPRSDQDPNTCLCSCPFDCEASKVQNADTCECTCPGSCPPLQERNSDGCGCHCATACIATKVQDPNTCACTCPATCPSGQVQDANTCSCSCPTACPTGKIQDGDCDCLCATACVGAKSAQNPETCECSCPNKCPAGQIQNPSTCECGCTSQCPAGQVRDSEGCGCHCATSCAGAASVQNEETCACTCPNSCAAGEVLDPTTCICACPSSCPSGMERNTQNCGCHCANSCDGNKSTQDPTTCECMCPPVRCAAGFIADSENCGCKCNLQCAAAKVVNTLACSCECPNSCPAGLVQDHDTCECHCSEQCPLVGQVQDANTCACSCAEECPAGQVRNDGDCGCHCANSCDGTKSAQNKETCECTCPNVCNEPFAQDDASCACVCPNTCAAPLVLDPRNCYCACPAGCSESFVQNKETCECTCSTRCAEDEDLDNVACQCVARSAKQNNKAAIIGGAVGGAVALAALAALAAVVLLRVRARLAQPGAYHALSADDSLGGAVTNPAFMDSGMSVVNPAFGKE